MDFQSALIHGGIEGDEHTGAVNVPIYQTSTYRQEALGKNKGYEYSRTGNPTREALEKLIAELEEGSYGLAFASGMAAIATVLMLFKSGDKILISNNVYGGTYRIIDKVFKNFNLDYAIVDTSDEEEVLKNITAEVKAIIIETPTNPLMSITDIGIIADIAKSKGILTIVDNTFMTPYLQKPLTLGADIVIHSATKYLGGHSDLIAGLVVVKDKGLGEKLYFLQNAAGGILQPFDSWLLIRGIKTLAVRMDRHMENAAYVVDFLRSHTSVVKIYYPGLQEHKGHNVHKAQASGFGAMISFELKKDIQLNDFFSRLKLIALGESLGGVESLISHPASMTHASIPASIREKIGITDNLIRVSIGIESKKDLVQDLERALGR